MSESTASRDFYNTIARYYDAENEAVTEDLDLYAELAEAADGPVLDVGCGTGRVMLHLAVAGHRVQGIDLSAAMLERGRRKVKNRVDLADHVTFYEGNALDYPFSEKYALIIVPYNGLMHFRSVTDILKLLGHLADCAAEDCVLVLDLPNAGEAFATLDDDAVTLERTFIEPESGNLVMQQSVSQLNRTDQLQYITWIYDEIGPDRTLKRTVAPLTLRYIFPTELDLLLQISGWQRMERFGDYDRSPFEEGCPRLIVLARLNGGKKRNFD